MRTCVFFPKSLSALDKLLKNKIKFFLNFSPKHKVSTHLKLHKHAMNPQLLKVIKTISEALKKLYFSIFAN